MQIKLLLIIQSSIMKIRLKFLIKILFYTLFLINPSSSYAEISNEEWEIKCNNNNENEFCIIAAAYTMGIDKDNKKQNIISYIQISTSVQKQMSLVNEADKTYKMDNVEKKYSTFYINLPLNMDLRVRPLLQIDEKNIVELSYMTCTQKTGCKAAFNLSKKYIKFFNAGKKMNIISKVFGSKNNKKIIFTFPLKNFSKSYKKLIAKK